MCRKNKHRKHRCSWCGHDELNDFYGYKSYDDIPFYAFDFYDLYKQKCCWCGTEFYYLFKKEGFNIKLNADSMFEKLGYEKYLHIDRKEKVWGEYFYNKRLDTLISFDYIDKGLCCSTKGKNAEPIYIQVKELEAINQKCEELGWIK